MKTTTKFYFSTFGFIIGFIFMWLGSLSYGFRVVGEEKMPQLIEHAQTANVPEFLPVFNYWSSHTGVFAGLHIVMSILSFLAFFTAVIWEIKCNSASKRIWWHALPVLVTNIFLCLGVFIPTYEPMLSKLCMIYLGLTLIFTRRYQISDELIREDGKNYCLQWNTVIMLILLAL